MKSSPTWHLVRHFDELFASLVHIANHKSLVQVAVEAAVVGGDVHIDNVAIAQRPLVRDAVADDLVDGRANALQYVPQSFSESRLDKTTIAGVAGREDAARQSNPTAKPLQRFRGTVAAAARLLLHTLGKL